MRVKSNHVSFAGLAPQLVLALFIAEQVYAQFDREITITSCNDSEHSETSLHYSGNAVDLRTQNPINGIKYFEDANEVVRRIKDRLNGDFDVMFEGDHIHLEYQPRKKP